MAYDPNYTPEDDEFARAAANTLVGTAWIVIGSLIVIFVSVMAVAHYIYDVPVYRRHGPGLASAAGIAFVLLTLGTGGTFAIFAGFYIRRQR